MLNHGAVVALLAGAVERGRADGTRRPGAARHRQLPAAQRHPRPPRRRRRPAWRSPTLLEAAPGGVIRPLRPRRVPGRRAGRRPRARAGARRSATASSTAARVRRARPPAGHGQRRHLPLPGTARRSPSCSRRPPRRSGRPRPAAATVRVAGAEDRPSGRRRPSFDVLQGLVFAVDTKDRYTKRHSEDVARYAVFLAERLGLDDATSARSASPACSTTSARSASPRRSCASPAS